MKLNYIKHANLKKSYKGSLMRDFGIETTFVEVCMLYGGNENGEFKNIHEALEMAERVIQADCYAHGLKKEFPEYKAAAEYIVKVENR